MRRCYRLCLLAVQLMIVVPFAVHLGSMISGTREEMSVMKRRALDTTPYRRHEDDVEKQNPGDVTPNRGITAKPQSYEELQRQKDLQVNTPLIPIGPDESPPRKPAAIPKNFTIEEADFCQKRPGMDIIAYVHSSISGVTARDVTRRTWANATAYNLGVNIGVVFMVGRPKNEAERIILKEESARYHDIVQGDYGDHYRLLSYKGLASLHWINKHCPQVPWTLHADDDVLIDIFLFRKKLKDLPEDTKKKFICSHAYGPALREGRWYVSLEQYPNMDYPLYCSGGTWFLQTRYLHQLLRAAKVAPFLWVDDAYLTGILAEEAKIERHPFKEYYGSPNPNPDEIGQKVAWFYPKPERLEWWENIVALHRNSEAKDKLEKPETYKNSELSNDTVIPLPKIIGS